MYETKIVDLKRKLDLMRNGFRPAKCMEEKQKKEVYRLMKLNLKKHPKMQDSMKEFIAWCKTTSKKR